MRRPPDISKVPEFAVFRRLTTPEKIQDFVDALPINFANHERHLSPLSVLRQKKAHCIEGALLAAAIFWYNGERPLLLDLLTNEKDFSHVVALFKRNGRWGAVSKTNHAVLRYRDPVYKNIRELAMSYFNEYFLDNGEKTLRTYSLPFSLLRYGNEWLTSQEHLEYIAAGLDAAPHRAILPKGGVHHLRRADRIERETGKVTQWKRGKVSPNTK